MIRLDLVSTARRSVPPCDRRPCRRTATGRSRRARIGRVAIAGLIGAAALVLGPDLQPHSARAACTDPAGPNVNWRRCYHDGRSLEGVDLTSAELRDATFQRSDLDGSDLTAADAFRAKFISASLNNVVFHGARLYQADLTRADARGSSFVDADLRLARLINADLRGVDLTGAELGGADLRNAQLTGATWVNGTRICAEGSVGQCN